MHLRNRFLLQTYDVNNAVNVLYFMAKRDGVKTSQPGEKMQRTQHWFDEECMESKEMEGGFEIFHRKAMKQAE